MGTTTANLGRAVDFVRPDFHQVNLTIEEYLKQDRKMKLDSDDQICRMNLEELQCPLGPNKCPLRHTTPAPINFKPPVPLPTNQRERDKKTTVCKHYLRNLCKVGEDCEYTHDWNLRTMPVCVWFVKLGKCELGGECLYYHPRDRRVECPDYNRGFCRLGPRCPRRHVRRTLCQAYFAGFCPDGPDCSQAHPRPDLPAPESYINPTPPDPATSGPPPQLPAGYGRWREYKYDPNAAVVPAAAWHEGGSLQGWRAGGFLANQGRRDYNNNDDHGDRGSDRSGGQGGRPRWVKDLSTVLCFRCNQYGHFANQCPNAAVPGDRGGLRGAR